MVQFRRPEVRKGAPGGVLALIRVLILTVSWVWELGVIVTPLIAAEM